MKRTLKTVTAGIKEVNFCFFLVILLHKNSRISAKPRNTEKKDATNFYANARVHCILTAKSLTVFPNHQFSSTLRIEMSDISGLLKRWAVRDRIDWALPCQEPQPDPWSQVTTGGPL